MHNIQFIRKNPQQFDAAMVKRGLAPASDEILQYDRDHRAQQSSLQELQQEANIYAKKIGELKASGGDASEFIEKSKLVKQKIAEAKRGAEQQESEISTELCHELIYSLPNILADDVPEGEDEEGNIEVKKWGEKTSFSFKPKEHFELGENLGLMDFEQSAKISGSRFVVLKGALARLERALGNFMLDMHSSEFGYQTISGPLLVKDDAMFGSGQLPKFAEEAFATTNGYWLVPTSEVSLVNCYRDSIIAEEDLPIRMTSLTPCFRSEAGAAGRDTRGMIRQHQFWKVELVSITDDQNSEAEHQRMLDCAEAILRQLELPYRVMLLCAGDTGFNSRKTYDLEVWLPGQDKYREISSCSNCGDFQARRMKTRYKTKDRGNVYAHTLNGSALAVGRTLVAVLENYQQEDGSIIVPNVLKPYMGGIKVIRAV